jgi:hypothetical protein
MANTAFCKSSMLEGYKDRIHDCGNAPRKRGKKCFLVCNGCWEKADALGLDVRSMQTLTEFNYDHAALQLANMIDDGQQGKTELLKRLLARKWDPNFVVRVAEAGEFGHEENDEEVLVKTISDDVLIAETRLRGLIQ